VTYKFLAKGALGPISAFQWPVPREGVPGEWVLAQGPLSQCARGLHVCRTEDLAHWLHDELWELEIDGDRIDGLDCLVVERARLRRLIEAWDEAGRRRFVEACVANAARQSGLASAAGVLELLDDARGMATMNDGVSIAAYTAAIAVSRLGSAADAEGAFRRERVWQSRWIARELLGLT
jgi:hypothetical protein